MIHVHLPRAAHQHIADTRDHVHGDPLLDAVFQDLVPLMAVHAAQIHGLQVLPLQHLQITLDALFRGAVHDDLKLLRHAVLADQILHAAPHIVDHCRPARRERTEIPVVCQDAPDDRRPQLQQERAQQRQRIHRAPRQQQDQKIHNKIRQEQRKSLAVDHRGNA